MRKYKPDATDHRYVKYLAVAESEVFLVGFVVGLAKFFAAAVAQLLQLGKWLERRALTVRVSGVNVCDANVHFLLSILWSLERYVRA